MRNLLLFVLVLVGIWWVRRALNRPRDGRGSAGKQAGEGRKGALERMLGCDHCGVHVPESEGVRDGELFFCCEEHRRLGARHRDS
ncbi:PP0621 family protein [Aromatoleum toluolicum]|uniref:Preprotein translocase subunit YajC n=1 Tax=Aromatoleum toluolicum TaxID=90060 RepID=A0ABX1NMM3_9RHOO|nr:PP0621 family protein [Aromatoleum toluolicum]NMG00477.1 PP0621 family protein [Aromatoleum toluolicum]